VFPNDIEQDFKLNGRMTVGEVAGLRGYSLAEIASEQSESQLKWLIRGLWPLGSFGMVAGAEKTLKSYLTTLIALSVASGSAIAAEWTVGSPGPVTVFTGESGRGLWWRRAVHLGKAIGLSSEEVERLPVTVIDAVAPISSEAFKDAFTSAAKDSVLVIVDPLYVYYGADRSTGASNVFDAGELLQSMSAVTVAENCSLMIVNHFNKSASTGHKPANLSLTSITQAGAREWCETWLLLGHKRVADPDAGSFSLNAVSGSRQGYGSNFVVNVELGEFDLDTLSYQGEPSVAVVRGSNDSGDYAGVPASVWKSLWCAIAANAQPETLRSRSSYIRDADIEGTQSQRSKAIEHMVSIGMAQEKSVTVTQRNGRGKTITVIAPTLTADTEPDAFLARLQNTSF
jgi:hypothetical protein